MTDLYIDTEFLENGSTIRLISIAIVAAGGKEYYAVNDDPELIGDALAHPWLRRHVTPSLPITDPHPGTEGTLRLDCLDPSKALVAGWSWNKEHPDYRNVKSRPQIATEVKQFIRSFPAPKLWAWYASYDHVALVQLFGRLSDMPAGIPMWTNDLRQECERLGNPPLPEQPEGEHNALADARHNLVRARALAEVAARR
ncbi:3'-5' exoribonuclease domain-containing protein [Streptomyces sp. NPDC101152]|uniref:3'-5' exoribonuclease domain-containing protein n=1 Tax=Streptomyces sp. NPDC101152 TaxID=3366116 RepID=UPI0037FAF173